MSTLSKFLKTANNNGRVIIFVRAPEKGKVKTRLAASLGDSSVLTLYKAFVRDLIQMLEKGRYALTIAFYPQGAGEKITKWLGSVNPMIPQRGKDLGERMKNAFCDVFSSDSGSAVLIGSDTPNLSSSIIDEALLSLGNHDSVIGPAFDGGYYLIGFRKNTFLPDVFEGIEWSTSQVFNETMDILRDRGLGVHVLPKQRDIDIFDDVRVLFRENMNTDFAESETMKYLRKKKGVLL